MQSPPFGILGINNSNSHHAGNPPPKAASADAGTGQLPPIPVTNPSTRVGRRGGEGGEGERNKGSRSAKKRAPFTGDGAHTAPDTDDTLPAHSTTRLAPDDDAFADTSRTPHGEEESSGEEETVAAAPAAKKRRASNPYHPGCCDTLLFSSLRHQYPKDLPQGTTLLIKEWLPRTAKKKETGEEFRMYDLVDVNGGLWYGVPIFTFWRDQVDKGAMLEPDMEHNYIGLYKMHEDSFQIMLTLKPKHPQPKKK